MNTESPVGLGEIPPRLAVSAMLPPGLRSSSGISPSFYPRIHPQRWDERLLYLARSRAPRGCESFLPADLLVELWRASLSESVPAQQAAVWVYRPWFCPATGLTVASAVGFGSPWMTKKTEQKACKLLTCWWRTLGLMSGNRQKHDLMQHSFSKCITEVKSFPFFMNLVLEKVTGDERLEEELMQADNYFFYILWRRILVLICLSISNFL